MEFVFSAYFCLSRRTTSEFCQSVTLLVWEEQLECRRSIWYNGRDVIVTIGRWKTFVFQLSKVSCYLANILSVWFHLLAVY